MTEGIHHTLILRLHLVAGFWCIILALIRFLLILYGDSLFLLLLLLWEELIYGRILTHGLQIASGFYFLVLKLDKHLLLFRDHIFLINCSVLVPQVISFIKCLIFNKNRRWLGRARLFKWVARYPLNWMNKIYRWRPTELVTTAERLRVCAKGVLASEICVVVVVAICHRYARSLDGCDTCYLRREKGSLFKIGMKGTRERREALIRGRTCFRA